MSEQKEKADNAYKISVSGVMDFLKSPRHYKAFHIDKLREPSAAMQEGTALHLAVFEPERFETEVVTDYAPPDEITVLKTVDELKAFLADQGEKVKGAKAALLQAAKGLIEERSIVGVMLHDDWMAAQSNKIKLTKSAYDNILRIRDACWEHKSFRHWKGLGEYELLLSAEIEGVTVRGRIDWAFYNDRLNKYLIIDLKKCKSAQFRPFRQHIRQLNYHVQAWLYSELIRQNYDQDTMYAWLAAESALPNCTEMWMATEAMMEGSEMLTRYALNRFKKCKDENSWPGYSDGSIQTMDFEHWYYDEILTTIGEQNGK